MGGLKISMDLLDKPWKSLKPTVEKALNDTPFRGQYSFPADLPAEVAIAFPDAVAKNQIASERLYYAALDALKARRVDVTKDFAVPGKSIEIMCKTYHTYADEGLSGLTGKATETINEIQSEINNINKAKNDAVADTQQAVGKAIDDAWGKLQKQDLDLQLYKIKRTVNVAKRVVAVTKNVAKVAISGGANLAAWAMLVNELVGLIKTVRKACQGFDSFFNDMLKDVTKLESEFAKLKTAIDNDEKAGSVKRAKHRMSKMKGWFTKSPAAGLVKKCDEAQAKLTNLRKAADAASNGAVKLLDETEDAVKLAKQLQLPKMAKKLEKQASPAVAKMLDAAFKLQEGYSVRQTKLDRIRVHLQEIHVLTNKYESNYYDDKEVSSKKLAKWAKEVGSQIDGTTGKLKDIKGELGQFAYEMGSLIKALQKIK